MRTPSLLLALALTPPALAQPFQIEDAFPALSFAGPTDIQAPDDGSNRLFVAGVDGLIRVFENDPATADSTVFLDLTDRVAYDAGRHGLLGIAFDPDYAANGHLYVYYTETGAAPFPLRSVVSRFTVSPGNPNQADPASELILIRVDQPRLDHKGGQLQFGPAEGPGGERYLYVALGDGGCCSDPDENGQDRGNILGDLLRLDVDGGGLPLDCAAGTGAATVPPSNPFVDHPTRCHEIYASGFRNPWRFSFDPEGRLWLADVGENTREEIDLITSGGNYGWSMYEGTHCNDGPCVPAERVFPIYEYAHTFDANGGFSVTGGYVYDGLNCAALLGRYVYGDFVTGNLWALDYDGSTATNALLVGLSDRRVSTFGLDEQRDLYFTDYVAGTLLRLTCVQPVAAEAAPVAPPVVLGPGGGLVVFDVTFTNTTALTQTVDVWTAVDYADGSEDPHVVAPLAVTLPPGGTATRRMQAPIPAQAPAGTSTLVVKVGGFPDAPVSGDRFTVTKLPSPVPIAGDIPEAPEEAELLGASPNPFEGRTTVRFALPEPGDVRVEVLDLLGRRVAVLTAGLMGAGDHAVVWEAAGAPAGVYVVRMTAGASGSALRLTFLR